MKAVHFGAGNIGRGFIGDLLHDSGYQITFVEVGQELVASINSSNSYDIYFLDKGYEKKTIDNVKAISPISDSESVINEICNGDIITTSVWADNLSKISKIIAEGLKKRLIKKCPKVNVLACENALYASDRLKNEILKHSNIISENELNEIACFANTSVDRLALTNTRDGDQYLDIDSYFELVIEQNKLADPTSEPIKGADYTDNLTMYLERKLYICNCGHAAAGYLGFIKGYKYVQEAFADPELYDLVSSIMLESAKALIEKFGFKSEELQAFIDKNMKRFTLDIVKDDIKRVCRSPIRKLDVTDRLVAPCLSYEKLVGNVTYLPKAIASVFLFENSEDSQAVELQDYIEKHGIENSISHFTGLENGSVIFGKVLAEYKELSKSKENKMKLQLALDDISLVDALLMIEKVRDYVDIIEVGTPFVIDEGMRAVREIKKYFPEKEVLADLKIMDAGYYEAELAFEAGADYATVLGVTDVLTVKGCVEVANKYGKKIVVDMICVEDMPSKIAEMEEVGAHILAVHTGADQQAAGREPLDDLIVMSQHVKTTQMSVAGGINAQTASKYVELNPSILIVGSGITHKDDPKAEAKAIKEAMLGNQ